MEEISEAILWTPLREAAKKVIFLMVPLRERGGGGKGQAITEHNMYIT